MQTSKEEEAAGSAAEGEAKAVAPVLRLPCAQQGLEDKAAELETEAVDIISSKHYASKLEEGVLSCECCRTRASTSVVSSLLTRLCMCWQGGMPRR